MWPQKETAVSLQWSMESYFLQLVTSMLVVLKTFHWFSHLLKNTTSLPPFDKDGEGNGHHEYIPVLPVAADSMPCKLVGA